MSTDRETITITWESRDIRLSYLPRRWSVIDHVEVTSIDGTPLPVTETGYLSHFFGPVDPIMSIDEVSDMVVRWLDTEAQSEQWQDYLQRSKQLSLF